MTRNGTPPDLEPAFASILAARRLVPPQRALLVALSGIDGSGKGYLSERLVAGLETRGFRAVGIGIDGWVNLPQVRFNASDPGGHFYRHAIRFDELFAQLVLPLRDRRSHQLVAHIAEETATVYRKQTYAYDNVDIIVLEGIFLLQTRLRRHYDLSLWVDCSFDTALERAVRRGQEGLPPAETVRAFQRIYFPAQRIHFEADEPRAAADLIIPNDPRLT